MDICTAGNENAVLYITAIYELYSFRSFIPNEVVSGLLRFTFLAGSRNAKKILSTDSRLKGSSSSLFYMVGKIVCQSKALLKGLSSKK